jgi:hypothetical protein
VHVLGRGQPELLLPAVVDDRGEAAPAIVQRQQWRFRCDVPPLQLLRDVGQAERLDIDGGFGGGRAACRHVLAEVHGQSA